MNYGNIFILFIVLLYATTCSEETQEQRLMLDLIEQHFSDLPFSAETLPVLTFETWNTLNDHTELAPPPIDTVLLPLELMDELEEKGIVSVYNAEDLKQAAKLMQGKVYHFHGVKNEARDNYYKFSSPIFSSDYSLVILSVQVIQMGASNEHRHVFKHKNGKWEQIYSKLNWIE